MKYFFSRKKPPLSFAEIFFRVIKNEQRKQESIGKKLIF